MRDAARASVRISLRRGFTVVFAILAFGVGVSCVCLVWFANMLRATTTSVGESVGRHQMAEDSQRDLLLRDHARVAAVRDQLGVDVQRRLVDVRVSSRDVLERAAADDAVRATTAEITGEASDANAAHEALGRLAELERTRVASAQADAERLHRIAATFAGSTAVLVVAAAGCLLFSLHRHVLRPLVDLAACMKVFSTTGPGECREAGPEEVCDVARAFNALAARLRDQRIAHTTFIAGVAHDLRNPIQVLRMAVDLRGADGPVATRTERTVGIVRRQLAKLERLVSDLLDTTNLQAGKLRLEVAEYDLREIAGNVHRLVCLGAPRDASIALTLPPRRIGLECDGPRIEQVLLNVVNNAIKYSPEQKDVAIEVTSSGDRASVLVRDHGTGMTGDQLARVFEPFARGARAEQTVPGHGLGLYLSRCIVEQHGGAICVESTPGRGSVFRIDLPRHVAHVAAFT